MGASFPWDSHGLERSRFEAYAKLLRLRNGGQIKEASDFSEMPEEHAESADTDGTDSVNVNTLSHFDNDKLKRAFLDRLSELVANEKGALYVSSSLMIEWPDRVDILVAKNNGAKQGDSSFHMLETVASSLREISRLNPLDPIFSNIKQNLWASLVQSYRPRLIKYMTEAKGILKRNSLRTAEEAPALLDRQASLLTRLDEFRVLVTDALCSLTQDSLEKAVQGAYDISRLYNEQDFETVTGNNTDIRLLRNALGFLGRLRTCFNTLIRGANKLSNFEGLRILPAAVLSTRGTRSKKSTPADSWSVGKTFSSFGLTLDDQTVESVMGTGNKKESWTKHKLLQKFDKLKSSASEVHAEVQVILAAERHDCTGALIFKYVGCSKRSCFLCANFVQEYRSFVTRGSHGKLYNLWTVPEVSDLAQEGHPNLAQALKHVERAMEDSIQKRKTGQIAHAQESTVGGSSVATVKRQFGTRYVTSLVAQHLRSQREEMSAGAVQERDLKNPDQDLSKEHGYEAILDLPLPEHNERQYLTAPSENTQGECNACNQSTSRRCAYCSLDWFCSQGCQDRMPLRHLTKCSARSIRTTDILYDDVVKKRIPEDEQTREHFGFSRCRHPREESHLLGLYIGLLLHLHISSVQLNDWRQKGKLVGRIIETFSKLPEHSRGEYFPWFLRNQHVLDHSTPPLRADSEDNTLRRALEAARPYLEPEDRDKHFLRLEPPAKKYCFIFYAIALDSAHPNPNWEELDLWYDFGFATCRDRHGEGELGAAYNKLFGGNKYSMDYDRSLGVRYESVPNLPTCPFNEFWQDWQDGSLAKLFDKYGLGDVMDGHSKLRDYGIGARHLQEFISVPIEQHRLRPSVWRLKHLLALDDNTPLGNFPQIEAAVQEYGFTPQLDARTKITLRQFYRQLLEKGDPLEVHEAKNRGELLKYAQTRFGDIDDRVQNVLRKLRPTEVKTATSSHSL